MQAQNVTIMSLRGVFEINDMSTDKFLRLIFNFCLLIIEEE